MQIQISDGHMRWSLTGSPALNSPWSSSPSGRRTRTVAKVGAFRRRPAARRQPRAVLPGHEHLRTGGQTFRPTALT